MDDDRVLRVAVLPAHDTRRPDLPLAGESADALVPADTLDNLSRLLSRRNMELLAQIKAQAPATVAELARLSRRPKASLMLTLKRMERFGILELRGTDGRSKRPVLLCDRLMLEVPLTRRDRTTR